MVDGVLLLVDASEGPLPQTRFVLGKALEAGLAPVVCLNKIDRADARPAEVLDEIYGLFIDLGANEEQLDFPIVYTNARAGTATRDLAVPGTDLRPLFETIVETLPGPAHEPDAPPQFQANNLGYDDYVGRLAIGRVVAGALVAGGQYTLCRTDGSQLPCKVTRLYGWHGLKRVEIEQRARATSSPSPASRTSTSATPSPTASGRSRCRRSASTSRPSPCSSASTRARGRAARAAR